MFRLGRTDRSKKQPGDLLQSIESKQKSLNFAIQNEVLEQAIRLNQSQKVLTAITKLSQKKPWEYYEDGKYLITQKKWDDAKANFIHYRNYVEQKTPIISEKNDNGIKPPSEDNHLKYLAYIQDQISVTADDNPLFSVVSVTKANTYKKQWEQWQKDYMTKKK